MQAWSVQGGRKVSKRLVRADQCRKPMRGRKSVPGRERAVWSSQEVTVGGHFVKAG